MRLSSMRTLHHSVYSICNVALIIGLLLGAPLAEAADLGWQHERHDARRTGFNPGKAKISAPAVRWRLHLGGSATGLLAVDADLDGEDDALGIEAGAVAVRTIHDKLLWKTPPIGATSCLARGDVDGDGVDELLCATWSSAVLLSTISGAVRWQADVNEYSDLRIRALGDFDGDGLADVAMANSGSGSTGKDGHITVYGFASGKAKVLSASPAKWPAGGSVQSIGVQIVDVDGDSLPDFLWPAFTGAGDGRIEATRGKDGTHLATSDVLKVIWLGRATSLASGTSAAPTVLCAANVVEATLGRSARRILALRRAGPKLQVVWETSVSDLVNDRLAVAPFAVGDLDGDGTPEVIASRWQGTGPWELVAFDALTGVPLHVKQPVAGKPGQVVERLFARVSGDPVRLVAADAATADVADDAVRRLWTWTRKAGFVQGAVLGQHPIVPLRVMGQPSALPTPPIAGSLSNTAGAIDLLRQIDTDADASPDRLELVALDAADQPTVLGAKTFAATVKGRVNLATAQGALLYVNVAGQGIALDRSLHMVNDSDKDGRADVLYSGLPPATVRVGSGMAEGPRLVVSADRRVLVLDASAAGANKPPVALFEQRFLPPAAATWAELDGKPGGELLVRHQDANHRMVLTALHADAELWQVTNPSLAVTWHQRSYRDGITIADLNGDGAQDILAQFSPTTPKWDVAEMLYALDGKTGKPLWPASGACTSDRVISLDTTGATPLGVASIHVFRNRCDLAQNTVTKVQHAGLVPRYGYAALGDLDGKPPLDAVIGHAAVGIAAEFGAGHTTAWSHLDNAIGYGPFVLILTATESIVVQSHNGSTELWAMHPQTGKELWRHGFLQGKALAPGDDDANKFVALGLIAVGDLVGDGHAALLFRTTEGRLYAVRAHDGHVHWSMTFGGDISDPVAADVDGDGQLDVLFATPDGYLTAIGQDVMGTIAWVRENDGSGPATSASQDIDKQELADRLFANWAPLAGAAGYALRVTDADGAEVVPLRHMGTATSVALLDLHLHVGHTYHVHVSAYGAKAGQLSWSLPTTSDGVTIVDQSAPHIDSYTATPTVLTGPAPNTDFAASLRDATRLGRVELSIRNGAGEAVYTHTRPLATSTWQFAHSWTAVVDGKRLAAGTYEARVTATDQNGYAVSGALWLTICALGEIERDGGCGLPDIPGPGDVGSAQTTSSRVGGDDDGGCGAGSRSHGRAVLLLFLLGLGMLGLWRNRNNKVG